LMKLIFFFEFFRGLSETPERSANESFENERKVERKMSVFQPRDTPSQGNFKVQKN